MSAPIGALVTRTYEGFRGVDFRGAEVSVQRSPDSLNMWKDYRVSDSIRTRPAVKFAFDTEETVHSISFFGDDMMVHAGTTLYKVSGGLKEELGLNLADNDSAAFVYDSKWYMLDGNRYICYDGESVTDVVGFIPTTTIARSPKGGGTIYQSVNMLSDYRINTFVGDGESTEYYLDVEKIDNDFVPEIKVNGEPIDLVENPFTAYVDGQKYIKFTNPLPAPLTTGQANVEIKFKVAVDGYRRAIEKCRMVQIFDNRVFVTGNPDHPNMFWCSGLHDPTYFADDDRYQVGMDDSPITGMVAGNDALWVFRRPSQENAGVFYYTPITDEEKGRIYAYRHSSISTGCVGKAINFNDDIVFFSPRGMEGVNIDITKEQAIAHRSTLVDAKMLAEAKYEGMKLAEWEGYLLIFIGDKVYVADSRSLFTNDGHVEYDFFYWDLDGEVTAVAEKDGVLYIGTSHNEVCVLTTDQGSERSRASYWVTPRDKFNADNKVKTTNKRGFVVEAQGDIKVDARTDNGEYSHAATVDGVTDRFTCRIKRKKWNDIQLKIQSANENGFVLKSATLEAYVGGYLK
jgi:hypothetical protein